MEIVLYEAGSGGDMISATIDNRGYEFNGTRYLILSPEHIDRHRLRLSYFVKSMTDEDRDQHIIDISKQYKAVASHLFEYHISRKHDCLFIDNSELEMNAWRLQRVTSLFDMSEWGIYSSEEHVKVNSALTLERAKHFPRQIKLRDVLEGRLIKRLEEFGHTDLNEKLYFDWLQDILTMHPL